MATVNPGFKLVDGKYIIDKDPTAELDYYWILTDLIPTGDSIATVQIMVTGGLVEMSNSTSGSIVTVWLKGGTVSRKPASCTVRYTTTGGRKDDRTAYFQIVEK